jgi:hypothetical protein
MLAPTTPMIAHAPTARRFVYLAGPILGCTGPEANDWRTDVAAKLEPFNIIGISPLRCEPLVGERYDVSYPDPCFGTADAIAAKNRFDTKQCDMGLFYIPKPVATDEEISARYHAWVNDPERVTGPSHCDAFAAGMGYAKRHSFGTVGELFWTDADGKQTIVVTDDPFIRTHPVIKAATNWQLDNFDDAVRLIVGVLGGYTGGKHV